MSAKTVLITGGVGGIGFGIAQAFLQIGYRVVVTGIQADDVSAIQKSENLKAVKLDVTDQQSVNDLIGSLDRLDALVNCAGIIARGKEFDLEVFERVISVNLTGTMRMCVAAHSLLKRSESGAIVNLASMLSYFGGGLVPAYSASKGGIVQLTKSLAIAWAADKIRVNAVAPGWIETELTRPLTENSMRSDQILTRTPLNRWGRPDDIGPTVYHLCSDAARFITGTVVNIDGGYAVT